MFTKILVANRGEIAVRIIRTCRELGISTVAVYSTADADSAAVRLADEAVCIGPAPPRLSYLNIPNIIGAAQRTGADAVHPGYGFLSEDPYFAEICADHAITFIGPDPETMETLGDKAVTRKVMSDAGLPVLPGVLAPLVGLDDALAAADEIGYPVILKATAGGGGRGIAVVRERADMPAAYRANRASARALFKDPSMYLEKYLSGARHVEVQVLGDSHGTILHLGERDCSVQRRHQKLIEESPCAAVDEDLRARIGAAALTAARAVDYTGAGTVEFLLAPDGAFWLMEMNARLQVEHPVTEMVSGIDLVAEQIRAAAGERLSVSQDDVVLTGHAVECRVTAEDVHRQFRPTVGRLERYLPPGGPGVRVESHCRPGDEISAYYDSLLAKLVVWAPDRPTALARMDRALDEFDIAGPGISTTVQLQRAIVTHPVFAGGEATTDFIDQHGADLLHRSL